jgi:hypothetical protein
MFLNRNRLTQYLGYAFVLLASALLLACGAGSDSGSSTAMRSSCVLIDNDYDIDDMMAIPLVVGSQYVAAIVQSEGYTMPEQSAPAIEQLINNLPDQPNQRKIPIIVGGQQGADGRQDLTRWSWLPFFRSMMNLSNGLFSTLPTPAQSNSAYAQQVANSVASCSSVSVLIIGTYTSFINYSPLIRDKISKVVIMGQGIRDDSTTPGKESFNCNYDFSACETAMDQLVGLNAFFVDIPRISGCASANPSADCYSPSYQMVAGGGGTVGLNTNGLPSRLKSALMSTNGFACSWPSGMPQVPGTLCNSQSTWVPADVYAGPGGEMLLWDQTAALFMLHPEIFEPIPPSPGTPGRYHYEPTLVDGSYALTIQRLRQLWTQDTNRATTFYQ